MTNLDNLNDAQKIILTELAYLDVNMSKTNKNKLKDGNLTIGDILYEQKRALEEWKSNKPDSAISSDEDKIINKQYEVINSLFNKLQFLDGIADWKIKAVSNDNANTGFAAIAFEDSEGNTGISYRGSEVETFKKGFDDYVDNGKATAFGESAQNDLALEFFKLYKDENGNNHLFGHSKGGNLTSTTYDANEDEVKSVFLINAQPINELTLKNGKDIFQSDKVESKNVEGDFVSGIGPAPYDSEVIGIAKEGEIGFMDPHALAYIAFDENGNFLPGDHDNFPNQKKAAEIAEEVVGEIQVIINDWQNSDKSLKDNISVINEVLIEIEQVVKREVIKYIIENFEDIVIDIKNGIKDSVIKIVNVVKEKVKNAYNKVLNKIKGIEDTSLIKIDTELLKSAADRLEVILKRVNQLDKDLNDLYRLENLVVIQQVIKANAVLPSDKKFLKYINYLNETATAFETAESKIKSLV